MKKDIHPEYEETTITCACGSTLKVRSTGRKMHLNMCSNCHPFYSGRATLADSAGRVEQFRKRYGKK